jgi:hypothetical protein
MCKSSIGELAIVRKDEMLKEIEREKILNVQKANVEKANAKSLKSMKDQYIYMSE